MTKRFTLYGLNFSGPTYKVALMLSLAGQDFAYKHVNLRGGEHKKPEFLAINRFGQVPALQDNSDGRVFVQSAAILETLADRLDCFGGADRWERIQARETMLWEFDRIAPPIYRLRAQRLGVRSYAQPIAEMYFNEGKLALTTLDELLGRVGTGWLVGKAMTIADIDMYGVIHYAPEAGHVLADYPQIAAWVAKVRAAKGFADPAQLLPTADRA